MILGCHDCRIMISVSRIPGGNPAAINNPHFATSWETCGSCRVPYCSACARKRSKGFFTKTAKCDCGGEISPKYNIEP